MGYAPVRGDGEEREWSWNDLDRIVNRVDNGYRLHVLLYADDLVLFGESEDDLRAMVGRFDEVCSRRDLKVCVLDESCIDEAGS